MGFECVGCGGMPQGANNPCNVCGETSAGVRAQYAMIEMKDGVCAFLKECCGELLEMMDTAILPQGHVRRLAHKLVERKVMEVFSQALSVVQAEVSRQAMRAVVETAP